MAKTIKAINLEMMDSSPAPKEWKEIPEIKAAYPKIKKCEISLQKLDGLPICQYHIRTSVFWNPVGDFFYVEEPKSENNGKKK
jgi:hypothetical protein